MKNVNKMYILPTIISIALLSACGGSSKKTIIEPPTPTPTPTPPTVPKKVFKL